ncbi:MAG: ATP-binding protein [Myxococcales bacterium]|nr:ATP-binding protein [Myxococcales bacterium]
MLTRPTHDKLVALRLRGMAHGYQEQLTDPDIASLDFDTRFALLVEAEALHRDNRQLARLLKEAKLRLPHACVEELECNPARGLDLALVRELMTGRWITEHRNVLITGATGTGKTYTACALGQHACRQGRRVSYRRLSRLLEELMQARALGGVARALDRYARVEVLIIDDWGLTALDDSGRRDLLELLDDRYGRRSTVITSQLPTKTWHDYLGEPTVADAILDRLVHNAYKIALKGGSMRTREVADRK